MKRYTATFDVALADVGLARSLTKSVVRDVGTISTFAGSLQINGQVVLSGANVTQVLASGTGAQLDEIAGKLQAAGIQFKQHRELPASPR